MTTKCKILARLWDWKMCAHGFYENTWQNLRSADYGITGKCHGIDVNFPAFDNWLYNRISLKYLGIEA